MNTSQLFSSLAKYALDKNFDLDSLLSKNSQDYLSSDFKTGLKHAMLTGEATNQYWKKITSLDIPANLPRAIGQLWDQLEERGVVTEIEEEPSTWSYDALYVWAYTYSWYLSSQDEDLLLLGSESIELLLKIYQDPDCLKRDYILDCVIHGVRDTAHSLIGSEKYSDYLIEIEQYLSLAEQAGATDFIEYVNRLKSYEQCAKVNQDEAIQRAKDLTRCREPQASEIELEKAGKQWIATLPGYFSKKIKISSIDGKITI